MKECPVCRRHLNQITLSSLTEIDFCSNCRGVWFEKEELKHAREEDPAVQGFLRLPVVARDPVPCRSCGTSNPRLDKRCRSCKGEILILCPVCRTRMEEVPVSNVLVDRCAQCSGVWLDGGELAVLFEQFKKIRLDRSGTKRPGYAPEIALDALIWAPDLVFGAAQVLAEGGRRIPGAVEGIVRHAGDLPEFAGKAAEGTMQLAGHAADLSGDLVQGALHVASQVPEAAGTAAEVIGSFIEGLLALIASLFD